jgi:CO/xanthine dehydrogenase FAD-binding subunit
MKLWSHYHIACSVDEALDLLARYEGRAQVIAGGTDLLLDIQQGNHAPVEALIDITKIHELTAIQMNPATERESLMVGASVTHNAIVTHPVIRTRATCLAESCGVIGGPQVRNVATIGGNVAHALPAADGTLSLVALRARAEVASTDGRTWHDIEELFGGPGQSFVNPARQIITRFEFALSGVREASAFKRIMRPQGVALPILGCAVWVRLDEAGDRFEDVSVCVGPTGPTPKCSESLADALVGQPANEHRIAKSARLARDMLSARASKYRATAEYRTELIELLVRQSLELAVTRAKTGEIEPEGIG